MNGIYLVPLGVVVVSALCCHAIARRGGWGWLIAIAGAMALLCGFLLVEADRASGWDGLAYAIWFLGVAAPAGVGVAIGTVTGWLARRRGPRPPLADPPQDWIDRP